MLVITNIHGPCCSIIFSYYITKPNILFPYYTLFIAYSANYVAILATFSRLLDFCICLFYACPFYPFYNANINAIYIDQSFQCY